MTTTKFTPGPWIDVLPFGSVVKKSGTYPLPVDEDRHEGESWLEMYERTEPARKARDAEAEANKQIQIAAPELYYAANEALSVIERICPPENGKGTIVRLQKAIAKAEGKS